MAILHRVTAEELDALEAHLSGLGIELFRERARLPLDFEEVRPLRLNRLDSRSGLYPLPTGTLSDLGIEVSAWFDLSDSGRPDSKVDHRETTIHAMAL